MSDQEEMNRDTTKSLLLQWKNRLYLHQQQMLNERVIKLLGVCCNTSVVCYAGIKKLIISFFTVTLKGPMGVFAINLPSIPISVRGSTCIVTSCVR